MIIISIKARYVTNNYDDYLHMINELNHCGYFIYDTIVEETIKDRDDMIEDSTTVSTAIHQKLEGRYVIKYFK